MNNQSSSNGFMIGILVVLVVIVVGFLAYKEGYLNSESKDPKGVEINLGGSSN